MSDGSLAQFPAPAPDAPVRRSDDRKMLGHGDVLERYPGAVLVAGPNGIVLNANEMAEPLAELLKLSEHAELRTAIGSALAGRVAQIHPLLIPASMDREGLDRAFDVVVLPVVEGSAALVIGRDITLERSLRAALVDSRQRYKDLVEASGDFAWETDTRGRFCFVSPRGALGYSSAELIDGKAQDFLLHNEDHETSPFNTERALEDAEVWFRRKDGPVACLECTAVPIRDKGGSWMGVRGISRDVTEERHRQARLAEADNRERLLNYILKIVRDELEPQRMLEAAADALLPATPASGAAIFALAPGRNLEMRVQAGRMIPRVLLSEMRRCFAREQDFFEAEDEGGRLLAHVTRCHEAVNGALCVWRDENERPWSREDHRLLQDIAPQLGLAIGQLARERELELKSNTDPLTGLLNRRSFFEALDHYLERPSSRRRPLAFLYIDMDNFKIVNDTHGHKEGDLALVALANLLRSGRRSEDLVARLGGDEFAVVLKSIDQENAGRKAARILDEARILQRYSGSADQPLGLSIGLAMHEPQAPTSAASLVERADKALLDAKRGGKTRLVIAPALEGGSQS